jgi:hypothetical protein
MSITLAYDGTTITLDEDYYWSDENWLPVEQSSERTVTGALVVSVAQRTGGRPITLEPENDGCGWVKYGDLTTLRAWVAVAGREMTLTLRGVARTVIFRHQDGAIEATPVIHYSDVQADDWYRTTLRFTEI